MEWRKSDETFFFVEGSTKFEENDDDPIKVYRVQDGDALKLVERMIRRQKSYCKRSGVIAQLLFSGKYRRIPTLGSAVSLVSA